MNDIKYFKLSIEYQSSLIDKHILLYLHILIRHIFLSPDKSDMSQIISKRLRVINEKINLNIIKDEKRDIGIDTYIIENL